MACSSLCIAVINVSLLASFYTLLSVLNFLLIELLTVKYVYMCPNNTRYINFILQTERICYLSAKVFGNNNINKSL